MQNSTLKQSIVAFQAEKQRLSLHASQRTALQILANIDMDKIILAALTEQESAVKKLRRLIERERLKGTAGHWSYDLNRHIALKQALDRLKHAILVQAAPITIQ
ncbi:cytoplasmic protein [Paenochrobactrum glaciei]|uniref:Cytoplasmic protein n=1 Tax=Paenochrobactrum glaciei TaxID=486407 RepID=A0ABN1FIW1_9HYPH